MVAIRVWMPMALAAMAMVTSAATASSWFFRPDNGSGYGQRDGSSYASAWHLDDLRTGPGHLDWSRIRPGDVLYVCGYHHTGRDRSIRPTISGEAGKPIVIDGECPAPAGTDPGIMMLAAVEFTDGWSARDAFGAYSRPYSGNTGSQLIEDTDDTANGTAGLTRLIRRVGKPDKSWGCGSFSNAGGGAPIYYKPSNADGRSGCDAPHWLYAIGSRSISFTGVSHFVIRNLVLLNQDRLVHLENAHDIAVQNNVLQWATDSGIEAVRNSDYGRIVSNDISVVRTGISMINQVDYDNQDSMDNWLISGNTIHDVDQDCYYACQRPPGVPADTHGIGINGGTSNRIQFNHIFNVGGDAIIFYAMRRQTMRDNIVQYNFLHDIKDLNADRATYAERNERGIDHGTSNDEEPDETVGNIVRYNVLARIDQIGIRLKSSRPSSGYSWSVFNNILYKAGTSFSFLGSTSSVISTNRPGFRFQNNISLDPASGAHIDQRGALDGDTSGIVISNNLFSPDATPGVFRYDWGATSYEALAAWRGVSGQSGGISGDPMFRNLAGDFRWGGFPKTIPGEGDFRLQSGSPAVDAGVSVTSAGASDISGGIIAGLRDIGAYEHGAACCMTNGGCHTSR